MPQKKPVYRTIIQFEVLSEEPLDGTETIADLVSETYDGSMSGRCLENRLTNEKLVGKAAVKAIKEQGSDPAFFGIDDDGYEIEM